MIHISFILPIVLHAASCAFDLLWNSTKRAKRQQRHSITQFRSVWDSWYWTAFTYYARRVNEVVLNELSCTFLCVSPPTRTLVNLPSTFTFIFTYCTLLLQPSETSSYSIIFHQRWRDADIRDQHPPILPSTILMCQMSSSSSRSSSSSSSCLPNQNQKQKQTVKVPSYCDQRRLAYFNYKFIMADNSQVCDGRLLRPFSSGNGSVVRGVESCQSSKIDERNDVDIDDSENQSSTASSGALDNVLKTFNFGGYHPKRNSARQKNNNAGSKISKELSHDETINHAGAESSSTARHRHSCPPLSSSSIGTTLSSRNEPREDTTTNNKSSKAILRQKHQPRHRLNHSITGIIRPSRYSIDEKDETNNNDDIHCHHNQSYHRHKHRGLRRASMPTRTSSLDTMLMNNNSNHSSTAANSIDMSNRSSDSWIPLGVDFCAHMEVYVFEKYDE